MACNNNITCTLVWFLLEQLGYVICGELCCLLNISYLYLRLVLNGCGLPRMDHMIYASKDKIITYLFFRTKIITYLIHLGFHLAGETSSKFSIHTYVHKMNPNLYMNICRGVCSTCLNFLDIYRHLKYMIFMSWINDTKVTFKPALYLMYEVG